MTTRSQPGSAALRRARALHPAGRASRDRIIEPTQRHEFFEVARCRAGWTLEELWISYVALGGTLPVLALDGYLCGLTPLPAGQQDVLACALNERLADLAQELQLPYLRMLLPDRDDAVDHDRDGYQPLRRLSGDDERLSSTTAQRSRGRRPGSAAPCGATRELIFERF